MHIRIATEDDLSRIAAFMQEGLTKEPYNEKEEFEDIEESLQYFAETATIVIAEQDELQGVLIYREEQYWEGLVIHIVNLVGAEKQLMDYAEAMGRELEAVAVEFVTMSQTPELSQYKQLGYEKQDAVVMRKSLE